MTEPAWQPRGGVTPKRHAQHVRRLAIVDGRQSPPQHVAEHVESTARH
jgi:hypothetical protein